MMQLLESITCPNCWTKFKPEEILWRSEHRDLMGDPLLGENEQLRFLPNRFDLNGNALDAKGEICRELACPQCHLYIPQAALERKPVFISILGTPTCGKSYYLAALVHELRRSLPGRFKLTFRDAHPASNLILSSYVEQMFLNANRHDEIALGDLIPKTQLHGALYLKASRGGQAVEYPRPFMFLLEPADGHPNAIRSRKFQRLLSLYDNAGEHFLPGADTLAAPGTRHLAESSFLLFLFDPTQDPRWFAKMEQSGINLEMPPTSHAGRQEMVLEEAASRIRRQLGFSADARYDQPLIIVVNKADLWERLLPSSKNISPLLPTRDGIAAINMDYVEQVYRSLRDLLLKVIPEITYAAESFWRTVYYLPASAVGVAPEFRDGKAFIRPSAIKPRGVALPFLVGLAATISGLVPRSNFENGLSNANGDAVGGEP
jgi:hypothetical protein